MYSSSSRQVTCYSLTLDLDRLDTQTAPSILDLSGFPGQGICAMVKSRYIGDGHPTFNRNPYNGYINPYYWVDDHPLLYGSNGSLDPGTYVQH